VGKAADETHPAYFNWDDPRSAARLRRVELPPGEPLIVLDEVHKYARWRNLVKGIYDTEKFRRRIVVTGSARDFPISPASPPEDRPQTTPMTADAGSPAV
jgi:predicted AAA+ superfamily ATPase